MQQERVIVIGGDHHNTLGVVRGLGERGVMSDLILVTEEKRHFVDGSKYIRSCVIIQKNDEIAECLLNRFANRASKSVVICCSDAASGQVDEHYDQLSDFFYLPGAPEQGRISYLMNKKVMADLAIEAGLSIPQSFYVDSEEDYEKLELPFIVKPLESRKGSKTDIRIVRSKDELQASANNINFNKVQIQSFIDKDFEYQLIGCSTGKDVIIPGVSTILRPCKGSNTSFLHYTPIEKGFCNIEACKEYVRRTGYKGLFSLEFLRDKNGKDYFMEINFRNDGNAVCVTAAGVSLPYIWYLDRLGCDYNDELKKEINSVYVMPDMAELKLLLTGQISLFQFLSDYKKTGRFMEYDKRDKKPFWKLIRKELHI